MNQDFEDRKKAFIDDYGALVMKYKVDFLTKPVYLPNGADQTWSLKLETSLMDTADQPVPSPFSV